MKKRADSFFLSVTKGGQTGGMQFQSPWLAQYLPMPVSLRFGDLMIGVNPEQDAEAALVEGLEYEPPRQKRKYTRRAKPGRRGRKTKEG